MKTNVILISPEMIRLLVKQILALYQSEIIDGAWNARSSLAISIGLPKYSTATNSLVESFTLNFEPYIWISTRGDDVKSQIVYERCEQFDASGRDTSIWQKEYNMRY